MNSASVSIVFDTMWLLARAQVPHALERVGAPPELVEDVLREPFLMLFEDEHDEPMELPVLACRAGAVFED